MPGSHLQAIDGNPTSLQRPRRVSAIGRTYKNHIDGYNLLPYLTDEQKKSPRNLFVYLSDDGDVLGVRYDNWKRVFMEQQLPMLPNGVEWYRMQAGTKILVSAVLCPWSFQFGISRPYPFYWSPA